ncbi:MAG: galactose mutarotase [Polyangiaceae bacterium]
MTFTVTESRGRVELADAGAKSLVVLAPERGGMAIRFTIGGREIFFMDESTLVDPKKNVRGGNPVLFPSPGKLEGDHWVRDGHAGTMKQHGFARDLPWKVTEKDMHGHASVTLLLTSSDTTRGLYPWDFRFELTYALAGGTLRIEQRVENTGDRPMPFGLGFHPYFQVDDKASARIDTRATRAFDNVTKKEVAFNGFDLTAKEVDLHLVDHGSTSSALTWGDGARLAIKGSPDFTRWVVWTLEGRPFVCVEPWTCPGNALNTGDRLIALSPGEIRLFSIELDVVAP